MSIKIVYNPREVTVIAIQSNNVEENTITLFISIKSFQDFLTFDLIRYPRNTTVEGNIYTYKYFYKFLKQANLESCIFREITKYHFLLSSIGISIGSIWIKT